MKRKQPKLVRAWGIIVAGELISAHIDRYIAHCHRMRWGPSWRGQLIRVEIRPLPPRRKARRKK